MGVVETKRPCNDPDHEGPKWLPLSAFHKQGFRNGKQAYRGKCKDCTNRQCREKYAANEERTWRHKPKYVRARSRALTRLSHLAPELYKMCLREELIKEGIDPQQVKHLKQKINDRKRIS